MGLDDRRIIWGLGSRPGQTVELVSGSETNQQCNTTTQHQLWATKMPILHIDPDYKTSGPNSQPARTTQHGGNVRPDRASRGFMRDIPGVFEAPYESGRLIIRAVNDNPKPAYGFVRSLAKRMIIGLYCWHLLSGSVAQRAVDRLRVWGA
jgi:hypothetical protein